MSENATKTAIEQENGAVASEETVVDVTVDQANDENAASTDPIYEQADVQEDAQKKKSPIKDIILFAQNKIFTPKICNIVLIFLGSLITALCLTQLVFWGLNIKDTFNDYWEAIKALDYLNIAVMAFMLLFILVLLINTIKSIVSLLKKEHEMRFEAVSTLFAFCIFSMFITMLFSDSALLISNFKFEPLMSTVVILVLVYAVIRLFMKDFGSRICPLAFSCVAIVIAIIMYTQNVGDFATFSIDWMHDFKLSDLNLYRYLQAVVRSFTDADVISTLELNFFEASVENNIIGIDSGEATIVILMQFVAITVSNLLPFAAISLLGYLMFCLVGGNYIQYYNLQTCKRISITMIIATGLSIAAVVCFDLFCKNEGKSLVVQIDYANVAMTVLLCVVMLIVSLLPWRIYNMVYKHRYAAYQRSEGGN